MRKILRARNFVFALTLIIAAIIFAASQSACAVEFRFTIPRMPATPKIVSVTNSSATTANPTFTISANIQGQVQKEVCCNGVCAHQCEPNCDFSACGIADFTAADDPRIVPNPTCVPGSFNSSTGGNASICGGKTGNPMLYWYYDGDVATTTSAPMEYDYVTGNFQAQIKTAGLSEGGVITYYIVASDNRGNVVSQVPDPNHTPCDSQSSWDAGYDTPPTNNCSTMNSYEQCGKFKTGTPACGSDYSVNDPAGDTCGESGTLTQKPSLDIVGISAGVGRGFEENPDQNVFCAKIKLSGNPPQIGDSSSPIDAYMLTFYNPDIADPDPNDLHVANSTIITYAPGANGCDCGLVKVVWNGDCVTDPNTEDPLSCKLIRGGSSENRVKIIAGDKSLTFVAQDQLPNGNTLVGSASKEVNAQIMTGDINLVGGTPFWMSDMTAGFAVVQKNQNITLDFAPPPADPCDVAAPPAGCNIVIKVGKLIERKILACSLATDPVNCKNNEFRIVDSGFEKAELRIIDDTSKAIVRTVAFNADGSVPDIKVDPVNSSWYAMNPGHEYRVAAYVPAGMYSGLYSLCENAGAASVDGCILSMSGPQLLTGSAPGRIISKVRPVGTETAADFAVGGGGDVGNPKVDSDPLKNKVDVWDMAEIKPLFGKTSSDYCYRAWADFDLSGKVDVWDMAVLKANFNKTIPVNTADGAPAPTLTSANDPLPTCCKTKSTPCP